MQPPFTANQETDARVALTRGLAEYLSPMEGQAQGGRKVRFKNVFEEAAEPEELGAYPAVAVTLQGSGIYEPRTMAPTLDPRDRIPAPDGRYLLAHADFVQDLAVQCWATDPEERMAITLMLERAFNPSPNRYGFILELPHYFNARGAYSLKELSIADDPDGTARRLRVATFVLSARIPLISLFTFPDAKPSFVLQAIGDGPDVLVTLAVGGQS
jgi:hypothetical protein